MPKSLHYTFIFIALVVAQLQPLQAASFTPVSPDFEIRSINPNPADKALLLELRSDRAALVYVSVFDITGNKRGTQPFRLPEGTSSHTFDTSRLESGIYFLKFYTEGYTFTRRMIVKHI